jgi:hypothetical protein
MHVHFLSPTQLYANAPPPQKKHQRHHTPPCQHTSTTDTNTALPPQLLTCTFSTPQGMACVYSTLLQVEHTGTYTCTPFLYLSVYSIGDEIPRGREAIGWHLSVYWKDDKQFYKGQVSDWDPASDKHQVGRAVYACTDACNQLVWGPRQLWGGGGKGKMQHEHIT